MQIVYQEGQQRSGRLGATIASHNRFGAYYRAGSIPVNPNTDRQVAVRNAVRTLAIGWQNDLSQAQRDAWEVYAANVGWFTKLGVAVKLTGANHYARCNVARLVSTIPSVDAAPNIMNIGVAEKALAVTASEATQQLTINGDLTMAWVGEADAWCFVYMGLPQNASIKFFGGPFRLVTAIPGAGPPPWPCVASAPFPFAEGNRIWVRTRIARGDGRLSDFAQINFLAAA